MTPIMRRTVRGAATGLGALALVAGASSCSTLLGGEDEGGQETSAGEEQAAEDESDAGSDAGGEEAGSDAGGDEAAGRIDEAGLTAAGDRFLEFLQVLDDGDADTACAFVLDPSTGEPFAGDRLAQCTEMIAPKMESLEPGSMDILGRSMIETMDNGDGTVDVTVAGRDFQYVLKQAPDGEWYVSNA
ncbi:hypothetical protein [Brachybacterium sacelli]|uniref:Secreted protein n=1 Tax=Brachybacterium sacelli TaxID=173364 RepID=A0ABS4X704_9MICO|nr:hypothetical protein [Brachybacterium sacelli]MBP2384255.1 hypothetical protein [Brachybacterium sacelli]